MKHLFKILYIASLLSLLSCNDFLDKAPSKSNYVKASNLKDISYLLNNYNSQYNEENVDAIYCSDDFGLIPELFNIDPWISVYGSKIIPIHHALWDTKYIPEIESDDSFFSKEYKKIFMDNYILREVTQDKTLNGSDKEKNALKGEAYFLRAYNYYNLVNTFCLPYSEANIAEMGLPIKKSDGFNESLKRSSLKTTWNFILNDLNKALSLKKNLEINNKKPWRVNTAAVLGFAARVYLMMNNYDKALEYANLALQENNNLTDYNSTAITLVKYKYSVTGTVKDTSGKLIKYDIYNPSTGSGNGGDDADLRFTWKELYYSRFLSNTRSNFIPSKNLLSIYDKKNDLRYKYFFVEHESLDWGSSYDYPFYNFFSRYSAIPSGPSVPEMYLIKAESLARNGKLADAMTTINILRRNRISKKAELSVINLHAKNQNEAIKQILLERRRELPFVRRFFDIRRFNNNNDPYDDVVITRHFYSASKTVVEKSQGIKTIIIKGKDRRFARPLPQSDIDASGNVIKQNIY